MLVGHVAVAMAARRLEPRVSFGAAVLAAVLADLLVFVFLIAGIERVGVAPNAVTNRFLGYNIAYSHSLLMDVVWAALFATAYWLRKRYRRGAWVLFFAVLSHWPLDVVSHRPDMPLAPGVQAVFGFGLWNSVPATLIVEGGFWLIAAVLYVRATRTNTRLGIFGFWIGAALLALLWYGNITAGVDPNPVRAGIGGLIVFSSIVAWAYWIDRLRPAVRMTR